MADLPLIDISSGLASGHVNDKKMMKKNRSLRKESNLRPADYKSTAIPLSH